MFKKILFVLGNGPSLKEIMNNDKYLNYLKQQDTFGLNAAYRAYEKYNFYPTYFGCFDFIVNESHKDNFEQLVLMDTLIQKFYFIGNEKLGQNLYSEKVRKNKKFKTFNFLTIWYENFPHISKDFDNFYEMGSSGANAVQVGILLGYKTIILLGCDCKYENILDGMKRYDTYKLEMTKNIKKNPNYWFDEYQQKGDKFCIPEANKYQMGSWKNLKNHCPKDVNIVNCSKGSAIPFFKKESFSNIIKLFKNS